MGPGGIAIFQLEIPAIEVIARTAIVYLALLVALRLAGKREIGQMTTFDLVVILLIANAVQNAMVGPDSSVTGGLIAAFVLLLGNYAIAWISEHFTPLRVWLEGTPTVLVSNGLLLKSNMRKESIDAEEIYMAMREHGIDSLPDVKLAVLEIDGSISIVPKDKDDDGSGPQSTGGIRRTRRFLKKH
jgi:uncharacterized membrane protein YcaP (DUF421 family)